MLFQNMISLAHYKKQLVWWNVSYIITSMVLKPLNSHLKKEDRISYALLKNQTSAQINKLGQMKFENPRQSKQ